MAPKYYRRCSGLKICHKLDRQNVGTNCGIPCVSWVSRSSKNDTNRRFNPAKFYYPVNLRWTCLWIQFTILFIKLAHSHLQFWSLCYCNQELSFPRQSRRHEALIWRRAGQSWSKFYTYSLHIHENKCSFRIKYASDQLETVSHRTCVTVVHVVISTVDGDA